MTTFDKYFYSMLEEMARPHSMIPDNENAEMFNLFQRVNKIVGEAFKDGELKGRPLIDSTGKPAFALDKMVLQYRKQLYMFLYLNYNLIGPPEGLNEENKDEVLSNVRSLVAKYTDKFAHLYTKFNSTAKLTLGIKETLEHNKRYIKSLDFSNKALNPTNIANFMNLLRVTSDRTSQQVAKTRELAHNKDIVSIDKLQTAAKPIAKSINRDFGNNSKRYKPLSEEEIFSKYVKNQKQLKMLTDYYKLPIELHSTQALGLKNKYKEVLIDILGPKVFHKIETLVNDLHTNR